MKKTILSLLVVLLVAVPVSAQTYLTTTTTTAAIPAGVVPNQTITVTSATDIEVNGSLYIDHELFGVVAVSGTRITVSRTQRPTAHVNGSRVIVAKANQKASVMLSTNAAQSLVGACTASQQSFLPKIDTTLGNVYLCWDRSSTGAGAQWSYTNIQAGNGQSSLLYNLSSILTKGVELVARLHRPWVATF